jgi:hypothetical protein
MGAPEVVDDARKRVTARPRLRRGVVHTGGHVRAPGKVTVSRRYERTESAPLDRRRKEDVEVLVDVRSDRVAVRDFRSAVREELAEDVSVSRAVVPLLAEVVDLEGDVADQEGDVREP